MPLHSPARPPAYVASEESRVAAVQPLLEHYARDGVVESHRVVRAWELYETPEVRFAARQYANAFSSAKLVLGRREVLWQDPVPVLEPASKAEQKAFELLESFAGGPTGQVELLDRMGVYFIVTGDMALVGAYDPAHINENKFARWDVWSTTEIKWTGQSIRIRESAVEDIWQTQPDYIKHLRVWNRHPRQGWESDSPVLSALEVLELAGLYDDRLQAEALSRLIGAGVWMIPQGMKLPTSTGATGGPEDFLKLLRDIAAIAIKDRRSAAANVPILIEAAVEDIEAASKGRMTFSTEFADKIGDLQERAFRRWATGVDLPAEVMLGMSQATHWNASLISEDRVQSFIVPSLRRAVGNMTVGWLRPALREFSVEDKSLELWFDPSGIKTRVDTADEAQWAKDRFMVNEHDTKYALGLGQNAAPNDEELKRQMLLHMAKEMPESVPDVLRELGIDTKVPGLSETGPRPKITVQQPSGGNGDGRSGPQRGQERSTAPAGPGRTSELSTERG